MGDEVDGPIPPPATGDEAAMPLMAAAGALAVGLGAYALAVEPRRLQLHRHRIPWRPWRFSGASLRILVLSDIHAAWPHMTPKRIARIVERSLALAPDLVLLPGDFACTDTVGVRPVAIEEAAAALRPLAREGRAFAVLGNHDWDYDGERVAAALEGVGIRVLRNELEPVFLDGRPLWLAGVDDPVTERHDLEAALAELPEGEPAVLLSHMPDVHREVPPAVRLVVAGHTHGGQVCLPGFGPLVTLSRLPRAQAYGLHETDARHLFVTAGVGTTGLPIRFARPPEIGLLELVPAGIDDPAGRVLAAPAAGEPADALLEEA